MACAGLKIFVIRAVAQILPPKGQYNTESFKNFMPTGRPAAGKFKGKRFSSYPIGLLYELVLIKMKCPSKKYP